MRRESPKARLLPPWLAQFLWGLLHRIPYIHAAIPEKTILATNGLFSFASRATRAAQERWEREREREVYRGERIERERGRGRSEREINIDVDIDIDIDR